MLISAVCTVHVASTVVKGLVSILMAAEVVHVCVYMSTVTKHSH